MTTVSQTLSREMVRAAERAYPYECVGALFGARPPSGPVITQVRPLDNDSDQDRRRRFHVSDRDYLACERHARTAGVELLGFYHSHPDHPAEPSATDLHYAQPLFLYIIISIRRAEYRGQIGCFALNGDGSAFRREPMRVLED